MGGVNNTRITQIAFTSQPGELPNISKYELVVIKVGVVTAPQIILILENYVPEVKKWMGLILEVVSYEHVSQDQ